MMLGHWQLRGFGQWTVVEELTGEIIGRTGFFYPEGWPGIELGWIIRPSRWGNGFATEASAAALRWAWDNLDIDRVISLIKPENHQSIRIASKLGGRFEGVVLVSDEEFELYAMQRPDSLVKA